RLARRATSLLSAPIRATLLAAPKLRLRPTKATRCSLTPAMHAPRRKEARPQAIREGRLHRAALKTRALPHPIRRSRTSSPPRALLTRDPQICAVGLEGRRFRASPFPFRNRMRVLLL